MAPIVISMIIAAAIAVAIVYKQTREFGNPLSTGQGLALAVIPMIFLGIGGGSYPLALNVVQTGAVSGYSQFLNGSIVAANVQTSNCDRSKSFGECEHTYDCDSYVVTVSDSDYVDSKGKHHARSHMETRWHHCPYATKEYSYTLTDSLGGSHTIASHVLAASPVAWTDTYTLWRSSRPIPSDIPRGVPAQWQHAQDGIASGNLDPVTVTNTYQNYILSSERTLFRDSSHDIDALRAKNLLPDHTVNLQGPIRDNFIADKINFVGVSLPSATMADWQDQLMRFNAALGMTRQGDLHIVVVKASAVKAITSPDSYLNAVKAHWLNDLGKRALAKNGIILVLAVDDSATTIEWSRGSTGMPIGNGSMLVALNTELADTPFSASNVLGSTIAHVATVDNKLTAKYAVGDGIAATIILKKYPFERACMGCKGTEDAGQTGFTLLSTEIPLSGAALTWTIVIDVIAGMVIVFGVFSFLGVADWNLNSSEVDRTESFYRPSNERRHSGGSFRRLTTSKRKK